jgi:hypothetical protein
MAITYSDLLKDLTPQLNAMFNEEYAKTDYREEIDFGTELERVDDEYAVSKRT